MKIGICTFNSSNNNGALLQAYALQTYLSKYGQVFHIRHDSEPSFFRHKINKKNVIENILNIIFFNRRRKTFRSYQFFRKNYIKYWMGKTDMLELENKFDVFVSGSDQVWNIQNGIDDMFYLADIKDKNKKLSYAASFGVTKIPDEYKSDVADRLSTFGRLLVREESGKQIIKDLIGYNASVVCDPVFLLPKQDWQKMFNQRIISEKYIFVYITEVVLNIDEYIKKLKVLYNCEIYSFNHIKGAKVTPFNGPKEFLNYIYYSEAVFATSFHAIAFSIIFNKKFYALPHSSTGARLIDMLNRFDMEECIIGQPKDILKRRINLDYNQAQIEEFICNSKKEIEIMLSEVRNRVTVK